jgi:hypothetical protein
MPGSETKARFPPYFVDDCVFSGKVLAPNSVKRPNPPKRVLNQIIGTSKNGTDASFC